MAGKNRIMIYGPKDDGSYALEFMTADGEGTSAAPPRDRYWNPPYSNQAEFGVYSPTSLMPNSKSAMLLVV
jgi:hypothetical protein